jgi:hypothetical protein
MASWRTSEQLRPVNRLNRGRNEVLRKLLTKSAPHVGQSPLASSFRQSHRHNAIGIVRAGKPQWPRGELANSFRPVNRLNRGRNEVLRKLLTKSAPHVGPEPARIQLSPVSSAPVMA